MRRSTFNNGFTLIELLIVLIIVGVLAVITVTQWSNIGEKSRITEARRVLWEIRVSWAQAVMNSRIPPSKLSDLGLNSDLAPVNCKPAHYFRYNMNSTHAWATRCTINGRKPQAKKEYKILLDLHNSSWSGTSGFK